jgi:DNA-binding GntR family transcriptional regulator
LDKKKSLSDTAYEAIREAILDLEFQPGEHLSEARLAQHFGMSRTPIREAIRRLTRERLVRVEPKRGIYVSELDIDAARMRMLIVGVLQGLAARLAADRFSARLTDQRTEKLRQVVDDLKEIAHNSDYEAMPQMDNTLHMLIEDVVGNDLLSDMIRVTRAPNERLRHLILRDPELLSEVALLHAHLGESVLQGDADTAEQISVQISQHSEKNLVDVLERWVVPLRERF